MPSKKYPEAIAHYPGSMRLFIKKIHNRIDSGKNALIVNIGDTGSGKSLSGESILIALHLYRYGEMPKVDDIVRHCVFKAAIFMKEMNNPDLKKKQNWMWDESGIDIGHKDHASKKNKVIGWLVQTFRNLQQVVIFTVPSISFIDASVRKLFHYQLETKSINKRKQICYIKPLELQYAHRTDKMYYHNIKMQGKDGYIEEIELMSVPKPPKEFVDAYELKKNNFTRELNIEIQLELEEIDNKATSYMDPKYKPLARLLVEGKLNGKGMAKRLDMDYGKISPMRKTIFKKYPDLLENAEKYLGKMEKVDKLVKIDSTQLNSQGVSDNSSKKEQKDKGVKE